MIEYVIGDATNPLAKGKKLIVHVCNDTGGWGRGFVLAISRKWPRPEEMYRRWYNEREPVYDFEPGQIVETSGSFALGATQLVMVRPELAVVNMIAQHGIKTGSKGAPIRYDALDHCLALVNGYATSYKASVHMPRIGTGLAGGKWDKVEPLIQKRIPDQPVIVYDLAK